jgi:hypothetical protein
MIMAHKKAPPVRRDDPEMRGQRSRTQEGRLRQKRADTRVDTIEEQYHVDLDVRGDTHLGTLRRRTGKSLTVLLEDAKKQS